VYGEHEMSEADHVELLRVLRTCTGKVMLSGYPSQLYDDTLKGLAPAAAEVVGELERPRQPW
jgi:hypothetical protein